MSDTFDYRPKFVDIRVKKPDPEAKRYGREREDANTPPCDQVGCSRPGRHRAPKGRDHSNEFWHFCLEHVSDYNRRWNYFSGMSEGEFADYQKREEIGHRPTWTFRGGRGDRLSAAMRGYQAGRRYDPLGMFGMPEGATAVRPSRRLTRMQRQALETMSLEENADGAQIRAKYAELVKRWHPDSNGGDRGAEAQLQRVLNAYQTLKAGGLV